jgi:LPS-assembly protein
MLQSSSGTSSTKTESMQPYEILSITVRGKYFFDKTFGGALIAGRRNQIEPMTALSFYTFGGVPRRLSPLNIDVTYRPTRTTYVTTRMDYGLNGDGLRDISATVGYNRSLFKFFQTFYYTRAVTLIPSLAQYADANGKEAGTLRGSQWSPSVFLGNRDHGVFGGASFFFDFQNNRADKTSPMISSLATVGYAYDCCSIALQYYTFNVGVRKENRFAFSFRLNGIGSFGTEQIGQGVR